MTRKEPKIPASVSKKDLDKALEKAANKIDGRTPEELLQEVLVAQLQYLKNFKHDKPVVDKVSALLALDRIKGVAKQCAAEADDKEAKDFYSERTEFITDIISRVKGLLISDTDPCYFDYVDEARVKTIMSEKSLDVIDHFGIEAPAKLNEYSIALEDVLIDVTERLVAAKQELAELKAEDYDVKEIKEITEKISECKDLKT